MLLLRNTATGTMIEKLSILSSHTYLLSGLDVPDLDNTSGNLRLANDNSLQICHLRTELANKIRLDDVAPFLKYIFMQGEVLLCFNFCHKKAPVSTVISYTGILYLLLRPAVPVYRYTTVVLIGIASNALCQI
jgi:hypothetical protein